MLQDAAACQEEINTGTLEMEPEMWWKVRSSTGQTQKNKYWKKKNKEHQKLANLFIRYFGSNHSMVKEVGWYFGSHNSMMVGWCFSSHNTMMEAVDENFAKIHYQLNQMENHHDLI